MNQPSEDIKRWTARRKAAAIMEIIKGNTTAAELARSHDLTVAEIDQWMDDFVSQGTEALRSHPRDTVALHKSEKKELLAKIGGRTSVASSERLVTAVLVEISEAWESGKSYLKPQN
jgi:transposase-like protein